MANQQQIKISIITLFGLLMLVVSYFLFNINTKSNQTIQPPFAENDIPFSEYLIHPDSSITINMATGTVIQIEAAIFENEDKKPIKGPITFKVREFHNVYDILRSGIPMSTNVDRKNFLQSAGMIEMRAENQGKTVKLKKRKQIEVGLAGYKSSEGYDLYFMNDKNNWTVMDRFRTDSNTRRNNRLKELSLLSNIPIDTTKITDDLIFSLQADLSDVPYLKPFANLQWRIDRKDINTQVIDAMRINWDEVTIRELNNRKMKYELVFKKNQLVSSGSNIVKQLIVKATPIIGEKNKRRDRQVLAEQMEAYKNTLAKIEEEKSRLTQEADMINSFTVSQLGIWNVDKIMRLDDMYFVNASFDFEKEINRDINKLKVFVIYEDNNSVIPYTSKEWEKIGIRLNQKISLVVVLPKNEIALVSADQMQQQLKVSTPNILFNTMRVNRTEFLKGVN